MIKRSRRYFNNLIAGTGLASFCNFNHEVNAKNHKDKIIQRIIPSTNELIPIIGLGTSSSFKPGNINKDVIANRKHIIENLLEGGGKVIDTAPSYGNSEKIIGHILASSKKRYDFFIATKVRNDDYNLGIKEMRNSFEDLSQKSIDLIQVHNLIDTKNKLALCREWRDEKKYRYIGVTHWLPKIQNNLISVMKDEKIDFVQFQYNIENRQAEKRLLPEAQDRGIATLINVPFGRGKLFEMTKNTPLPIWAKEFCSSWAQFYLKYIISNKSVTCVIPATSKVKNMKDNLMGGKGRLPDKKERTKMIRFMEDI